MKFYREAEDVVHWSLEMIHKHREVVLINRKTVINYGNAEMTNCHERMKLMNEREVRD